METQSKLTVLKNNSVDYIYIYYRHNNNKLVVNTKYKSVKGKMTKELLYNIKMADYERINKEILKLKQQVDQYINARIKQAPSKDLVYINQSDYNQWLKHQQNVKNNFNKYKPKELKTIIDFYVDFLDYKRQKIDFKPISFKDYNSVHNSLKDFIVYTNNQYYLHNLNEAFIKKYIEFTAIDLKAINKKYVNAGHPKLYKTGGKLSLNTLKKRLDILKEFCLWLNMEHNQVINPKKIFPTINKKPNEIIYLTQKEINEIISIRGQISNKYELTCIDAFILNLTMGLRFADLSKINKQDFKPITYFDETTQQNIEGYLFEKELQKTAKFSNKATIPIFDLLLIDILKQHDFMFNLKYNGQFNKVIKRVFERFNLLNTPITKKKNYYQQDPVYIELIDNEKPLLKRHTISAHTCRRTMITNSLLSGYSVVETMQKSGHNKIQTLEVYVNKASKEITQKNIEKAIAELKSKGNI